MFGGGEDEGGMRRKADIEDRKWGEIRGDEKFMGHLIWQQKFFKDFHESSEGFYVCFIRN
jgi:hypothetical protein